MTTINITIQLDNDAFADHTGTELASILRNYADLVRYDAHTPRDLPAMHLRDSNGNTVGQVVITHDDAGNQNHPANCELCRISTTEGHSYRPHNGWRF